MNKKRSFLVASVVALLASVQVLAAGSNFIESQPVAYSNNIEFISASDIEDVREGSGIEEPQITETVNHPIEDLQHGEVDNNSVEELQPDGSDNYIYEELELEEPEIYEPEVEIEIYPEYELHELGLHINSALNGVIPDMEFHEVITEDTVITSTMTFLNRNVLYLGNLTIDSIVNVNNGNLVVLGTLNIENNAFLTVSNANVYVGNDFRMQSRNSDGSFRETNGRVNISGNGRVTVLGDFHTQSTHNSNFGNWGATLELFGDFYQVGTNTFFRGTDGFTIIFSGDVQRVAFDRFDANAWALGER